MAAAAWSWVEKMLHEAQRTSAPRAVSVYLAVLNGVDPTPVDAIADLKRRLGAV